MAAIDPLVRIVELVRQVETLQERLRLQTQMHFQIMTALTHHLGGTVHISRFEFEAIKGVALYSGVDKLTGDLVFQTTRKEDAHVDQHESVGD